TSIYRIAHRAIGARLAVSPRARRSLDRLNRTPLISSSRAIVHPSRATQRVPDRELRTGRTENHPEDTRLATEKRRRPALTARPTRTVNREPLRRPGQARTGNRRQ